MQTKPLCVALAVALLSSLPGHTWAEESAPKDGAPSFASIAIPAPPNDKGQVVFFRKSSLMGAPYWTNVRENDVAYGKLSNGTYFVKVLDPGPHTFNTAVVSKDAMKIEVDPGETYFVEGKIAMAVIGYSVIMAPSDEARFQKVLKGMKPAKSEPANPESVKTEPVAP